MIAATTNDSCKLMVLDGASFLAEMVAIPIFWVIRPKFRLFYFQNQGRFGKVHEENGNVVTHVSLSYPMIFLIR